MITAWWRSASNKTTVRFLLRAYRCSGAWTLAGLSARSLRSHGVTLWDSSVKAPPYENMQE